MSITTMPGILPLGRISKGGLAAIASMSALVDAPNRCPVFGYGLMNCGRRGGEAVVGRASSAVVSFGAIVKSSCRVGVHVFGEGRVNLLRDAPLEKNIETGKLFVGDQKMARRLITRGATSRGQYNSPRQPETVALWLWICIYSYQTVRDALQFLWEQPGQLQYIEWPALQSTIKMAMLTVVVVAFLIIFLSTIDSTFSFVLSSILRRVP